jgi:hypothetical protein
LIADADPSLNDPALNIQYYLGVAHALKEISLSLSETLAHKKTVVFAGDDELIFENLAQLFSARGYNTKFLSQAEFNKPDEWLTPIAADLLFVMYGEDHPVTGEIHDWQPGLEALKSARLHRIAISHAAHRFTSLKRPLPFEIKILSLDHGSAVMVAGERGKIRPLMADILPLPASSLESLAERLKPLDDAEKERRRRQIESFESNLPCGFKRILAPEAKRCLDRAVFYHEGFDGSAVIETLSGHMGITLSPPGHEGPLEAMSLCRWNNPRQNEWFARQGIGLNTSRGLIVADYDLLTPSFTTYLEIAAKILSDLQGHINLGT